MISPKAAPRASALGPSGGAADDDALSVISNATDEVSLHPMHHFQERRAERSIGVDEAQHALKHGEKRAGSVPGTVKHDDGRVTVVRSADKTDITAYRSDGA